MAQAEQAEQVEQVDIAPIQAASVTRELTPLEQAEDARIWDDPSRRKLEDARLRGRSLLRRLKVQPDDLAVLEKDERFMRALCLWAIEFPLNIEWYEKKIPRERRYFMASRVAATVFGVATIGVTAALVLMNKELLVSQLGVLATGIFGVPKVLAAGGDPKTRLGGFQKARADLRESMFTFHQSWEGRPLVIDGGDSKSRIPAPDFMTAIYQEIRTGRKIARDERDTFFGTFNSATEILGAASTTVDAVRSRRTEVAAALKDANAAEVTHDAAVAARIQDLRNKLGDATALKEALEDKKQRLQARHVDQRQIDDVDAKIDEAETDRFKTQRLLDLAVKGDVAHPI
jgi:hypothetical protein